MSTNCPRATSATPLDVCPFCGMKASEACPLDEASPFDGPAIGGTVGVSCDPNEGLCESCQ